MKIVHICMTAYIDGWGYQDNLLPEYQQKLGHEVHVIASANNFPKYLSNKEVTVLKNKGSNYCYNNILIHRIKSYVNTSNTSLIYSRLYRTLNQIKPDLIFHHGVVASSLLKVLIYKRFHPKTKIVIDNHADFINCSKNKLWFNIYTKGIERYILNLSSSSIQYAYGVTKMRCDFLKEVYNFDESKIKLLPIGADTAEVDKIQESTRELRIKYSLKSDDIILASGGKMGLQKGTDSLIRAFQNLKKKYSSLKLLLFGTFDETAIESYANNLTDCICLGWCNRRKVLEILKMSDIACWPIHHTTLIEDAVACGTPIIVRATGNTEHLIEQNGISLQSTSVDDLTYSISQIINNLEKYKNGAQAFRNKLSYFSIAQTIIDDYYEETC